MPKTRQPHLVAPAPGRRCGRATPSSPPSSRAQLPGPCIVPVEDLPVWLSGPQFPWEFSPGSIVKQAPRSHVASSARWGPGFLPRPPRPGSPPPTPAEWRTFPCGRRGEVRGAVFDPPGSPRVTCSSDRQVVGRTLAGCVLCRALHLPVCFGGSSAILQSFGRKLLPLHLSSFVAAALKKNGARKALGVGGCVHSVSTLVICMEFYMLHLTQNLGARHSGRRPHSQGCHLGRHGRCVGEPVAGCAAHWRGIPGVTGAAEGVGLPE